MTRARSAPVPTGRGCQNAYGHLFSQLQSISKAGVGKTEVALCPVFTQPGSHGQTPRKGVSSWNHVPGDAADRVSLGTEATRGHW